MVDEAVSDAARRSAGDEPPAPFLEVANAAVTVAGGTVVLDGVSLRLSRGDVVVVAGPNGAGKTTLLRVLASDQPLSAGAVHGLKDARVALVPDTPYLYDVLTPREHLELVARLWRVEVDVVAELARFGLSSLTRTYARELSLGQRQRLALALALVGRPEVLLLDEPLNGLDHVTSAFLIRLIAELAAEGVTVLVATHLLHQLRGVATRAVVVSNGRIALDETCGDGRDVESLYESWLARQGDDLEQR
jgi:ABC-2 type transport system ATP-binding protein